MPKGSHLAEFEICVLLALVRLGDDAYGVTIRQEIESRTRRTVSIGAVYATLGRLAEKNYVTHHFSEPQPVRGGRARKFASITPLGLRALRASLAATMRMIDGIETQVL